MKHSMLPIPDLNGFKLAKSCNWKKKILQFKAISYQPDFKPVI